MKSQPARQRTLIDAAAVRVRLVARNGQLRIPDGENNREGDELGVGEAQPIAGGRAEHPGIGGARDGHRHSVSPTRR